MIKHLIIVRFFYDDKQLFNRRAQIMKNVVIECLKKQTCQDFKLCVMGDIENEEELRNILNYDLIYMDDYDDLLKFCQDNSVKIQTRHDSDDIMSDNYIEFIQSEYEKHHKQHNSFIMHFNWTMIDYETKKLGKSSNFKESFISGFCTLCEDPIKNTVYARSHPQMGEIVKKIFTYDTGYVYYTQHKDNNSKIPYNERLRISRFRKK